MPSIASRGMAWLQALFTAGSEAERVTEGVSAALDGATAVAVTEACLAEVAGVAPRGAALSLASAWDQERSRKTLNLFDQSLDDVETLSTRGVVSAAMGLALGGVRATGFVAGGGLPVAHDLLARAAGQHLSLVLHVVATGLPTHGAAAATGHDGVLAVSDSGWVQLFARNVQEAIDLTLVARRVAERALVPVMVVMDAQETAWAVQDVSLPDVASLREYVGRSDDRVESVTPAQRLLFGAQRRRIPRWFDLERPTLTGAQHGPHTHALAVAGQGPFFTDDLSSVLDESMDALAALTGRPLGALDVHQAADADVALVVLGSASEVARAVADDRRSQGQKVGVIALRTLRPFPGARLAEALSGRRSVGVLDRTAAPLAGDPPLMRLVRTALDRATENGRFGPATHPGFPSLTERKRPRLHQVAYGLGGLPVRAADVAGLLAELSGEAKSAIVLGVHFSDSGSSYPKRQVLLDELRRSYPGLGERGLRADGALDVRPTDALTVAIHRHGGSAGPGLAREIGALLHGISGGVVRSRGAGPVAWGEPTCELVTWSPDRPADPGIELPVDAVVLVGSGHGAGAVARLRSGAPVVLASEDIASTLDALDPSLIAAIEGAHARVFTAALPEGMPCEYALGTLVGALRDQGRLQFKDRQALGARRTVLAGHANVDEHVARFEQALNEILAVTPSATEARTAAGEHVPMAVRHLQRDDTTADNLPRFWSQVGLLYSRGDAGDLVPDPYLSAGVVPPLTSTFRDLAATRTRLPVFDATSCTGCGACWTACPEAAVAPVALTAKALIEAGMERAAAGGTRTDALRPILSKLAPRVAKELKALEGATAGPALRAGFDWLHERLPMPDDRKADLAKAFDAVIAEVGDLPVAVTDALFGPAEAVLSIAVNPDACKACGLCVEACEDDALSMVAQTPAVHAAARTGWHAWERLPDTPGEVVSKVWDAAPLAALELTRSAFLALPGGDGAEAGSGQRLALRAVLAAAEYHLQPALQQHLRLLSDQEAAVRATVRDLLADTLPADAAGLAAALSGLASPSASLKDVVDQVEQDFAQGRVDVPRLRRLVATSQALTEQREHLSQGPDGLGRARVGLVLAPGQVSSWAASFPYNPFIVPVTVGVGDATPQLARGLAEALMRQAVDTARLVRTATAEVERPATAPLEADELAGLTWRDLTDDERRLVPPLLLVGDEAVLAGDDLSDLGALLRGGLPVKVLLLASADLATHRVGSIDGTPRELGLLSMAHPGAYVVQGSLARPDHLLQGLLGAFAHLGPALVRVHAPSPGVHGFAPQHTLRQAELAVSSRAWPVFTLDPAGDAVFGAGIDLSANADLEALWPEGLTPAHWAATEARFGFERAAEDAATVPLADYLALAVGSRGARVPVVEVNGAPLAVPPAVVALCEERARTWATLQELAGIHTPFTARVRAEVEAELAAKHAVAVAELEAQHAAALAAVRAEVEAELASKVHRRLMSLAGYSQDAR